MRTLEITGILSLALLATLFILGSVFGPAPILQAEHQIDGQQVFEAEKCGLCHGVESVGIQAKTTSDKLKGPDLSGYEPEDGFDAAAFLRKQLELNGDVHRREFKGSDEELQALLNWLKSTKK